MVKESLFGEVPFNRLKVSEGASHAERQGMSSTGRENSIYRDRKDLAIFKGLRESQCALNTNNWEQHA